MHGIMGLQQGRPDSTQSDSAKAVWRARDDQRRPGAITRNLLESAGHEFPEPTDREEWEREMRWLDYLDRQRGERPVLDDKPWWYKLRDKLMPKELQSPEKMEYLMRPPGGFPTEEERRAVARYMEIYGPPSEDQYPMGSMSAKEVLRRLFEKPSGRAVVDEMDRRSGGMIPGYQEGGPTPSGVQTYDYGVPVQTEQQWADLTDRVVDEGSREYTPYGGQRLAGFTPQEIAAQQATEAYSTGQGPQGTIDAQTSLQTAGQQQSAEGSLTPYMSQYTQNVTDPQLRQLAQFNQQQMQNIGSQAAGSGAFGGYRQGVMQQQQAMDTSQQAADIIGTGQQKAFESAQQALQADRQAALGAGQAQASLGGQQQAQQRQRTGDLGMVGQQRRDLQQKSLDVGYQDFQNRLNQERSNIDWQTQAMSKMPYKGGVTQTSYGEQPTDWNKTVADTTGQKTVQDIKHGGIVGPMYSQFLRGMRR